MFSLNFWRQALERAVKSAAQDIGKALILVGAGATIWEVNWQVILGAALLGAVFSLVTSIGSAPFGESDSPSVVAIASAPPEPEVA